MPGPTGQPYYFNAATQESTYVRPLPAFPVPPPGALAPPVAPKKKERPREKTPIPGTDWLRVKTTEGNIFYTHKVEKRSVWTVPDEIRDAVTKLEREEEEAKFKAEEEAAKAEEAREMEVEHIKSEVDEMVGKRKAEEPVPVDEVVITKKQKIDEDEDEDGEEEDSDEEEEDWQREAAAQLAAEAEEERLRQEEEKKREEEEANLLKEAEKAKGAPQLNMPDRVDLSIDEAKALFKVRSRFNHARIASSDALPDITTREGRQPSAPMGYIFTLIHQ